MDKIFDLWCEHPGKLHW